MLSNISGISLRHAHGPACFMYCLFLYKIITCSSITWICRKLKVVLISPDFGSLKVTTFADMEGEETFDLSLIGHADEVIEERIADDDVILIKGTKNSSAVSGFFLPILKTSSVLP